MTQVKPLQIWPHQEYRYYDKDEYIQNPCKKNAGNVVSCDAAAGSGPG